MNPPIVVVGAVEKMNKSRNRAVARAIACSLHDVLIATFRVEIASAKQKDSAMPTAIVDIF
jgi:hypothetical protein